MNKASHDKIHFPDRTPINGTFELTIRCNLHCKMCLFRHDDSENEEIVFRELTAEQWVEMGRQVAEAGTMQLLVTGGEPFLRPDFCEIWEGIYKQGFIITLYTNATLVTPKVMKTLQNYPPHKIGITLYGASPETYSAVTGDASAFEKAIQGTKLLKTLPSEIEYRMTVIRDNYDDVDEVERLLVKEIDSNAVLTNTRIVFKAVRGGCADVESCRIPAEQNVYLHWRRSIKRIQDEIGDSFDIRNVKFKRNLETNCGDYSGLKKPTLIGCDAGMHSYVVSWDGKLLGCQMLGIFSNEINGDFQTAWQLFPATVRIPPRPEKCTNCNIKQYCTSCVASLLAEHGNNGSIDYICKDTECECNMFLDRGELK